MNEKPKKKSLIKILNPALIIIIILIVAGLYDYIKDQNKGIDVLNSEDWSNFPGATITDSGIHFQPLGRIIIHQDGSKGQENPPINLSGKHFLVKGNFKITAVLSQIDKQASFRLYASPPIIYDQWRSESPSIDINIDLVKNTLTTRIWDGSSSNSIDMRIYKIYPTSEINISIEHIKNQINILQNGYIIGNIPDHNIFDNGTIWFGADGDPKSNGWTLASLSIKPIGTGSVRIIDSPLLIVDQNNVNSLRNIAKNNYLKIKIGSAIALEPLFINPEYRELALSQFSIMTPENSMKPQFIHPMPNVYDFTKADLLVDIALKNKIDVHGHVLVYDKSTPDWMVNSPIEQRKEIMVSHIENVVGRYKNKVSGWDVVNEFLSNKNALYKNKGTGLKPNIWFEAMGEKYIDIAFATAHKADPSAKLYLNDYGLENDGQRWDALLSLVKRLKERKVPIDGIGFQTHIYGDGDYINKEQLKKHMEILNKLGLSTRISEIDVIDDEATEQINQYATVLDVCIQASNCTSYTTWGITDLYGSTTKSDRYPLVYGTSLLWDKDMKAKPAFYALQEKLRY
jgi:endo-1,4-beta-xylanase